MIWGGQGRDYEAVKRMADEYHTQVLLNARSMEDQIDAQGIRPYF